MSIEHATSITTPEELYAEHKQIVDRITEATTQRDRAIGHIAFIDSNPSDPTSDRLDRSSLVEELGDYRSEIIVAGMDDAKNIEQSQAHLEKHSDQYR